MASQAVLETPICFVIAPIGKENSETRKRSDQVLKYIIDPAAAECGFRVERADKIVKSGLITTQVIQRIIDAPFLIADLSEHNANVFYELAIRHAIRRPYVQIIHHSFPIPFDVAGVRTIQFDHQDLDSVAATRSDIVKFMQEMATATDVESPISVAVDMEKLLRSGDPEKRQLADIFQGINELKQL